MKKEIKLLALSLLIMTLTITVFSLTLSADEGDKVYISVSFDGEYMENAKGEPVAYVGVGMDDLAGVDPDKYGLNDYHYDHDGDGNDDITALYLYIYVHENIFGRSWDEVYVSGGAGSIFFESGLFGYEDCNLNYYLNGEYPSVDGWGVTADQLVLKNGDYIDVSGYTSWNFYWDSGAGFHYFADLDGKITHNYTVKDSKKVQVSLGRTVADMYMGTSELVWEKYYTLYYGRSVGTALGSIETDSDGYATITFPEGGVWYVWCEGGYGIENPYDIVSSPAVAIVEIEEEMIVEPSVASEGAVITVSGLTDDIKDIFIARGEYQVYGDVNLNKLVRLTQNKLKGNDNYSYTVNAGGRHTVLIRYNDNSMKFLYTDVDVTEPTFSSNALQLTVGNLDGIKVIRTASGIHKTASSIKKTEGARAFTAKDVLKGKREYTIQFREEGMVTVAVCYENGLNVFYNYEVTKKTPYFAQEGNTVIFGDLDGLKVIRYAKGNYTTSGEIKRAPGSVGLTASKIKDSVIKVSLKPGTYTFCVQYDDESQNFYTVTVD
ncbi:MAG: hypothetical protein E7591_01375 [Ruminococcaceae bacterium]|nr:hypothetical protein [Oscillospiraceae bacterium]